MSNVASNLNDFTDMISKSAARRREVKKYNLYLNYNKILILKLILQNRNFKEKIRFNRANEEMELSLYVYLESDINFNINNNRLIKLDSSVHIPTGNFYLSVQNNISLNKMPTEDFFFKYFGEDKLDKANEVSRLLLEKRLNNKKEEVQLFLNSEIKKKESRKKRQRILKIKNSEEINQCEESILHDDAVTNLIITEILKGIQQFPDINIIGNAKCEFGDLYKTITNYFPYVESQNCYDYTKRLFNRFIKDGVEFTHLSRKKTEDQNFKNIIGTFKTLYCPICLIYDCKQHFLKEEGIDFDNYESYEQARYFNTYRKLVKSSLSNLNKTVKKENINFNFEGENEKEKENEKERELIINEILKKEKEFNLYSSYKLSSMKINSPTQANINICKCSDNCYLNFLKSNNEEQLDIYAKFKIFKINEIDEFYFLKFITIFQFDPCLISQQFLLIKSGSLNKIHNNNIINEPSSIDCLLIYFQILNLNFKNFMDDLCIHLHNNVIKQTNKNFKKSKKTKISKSSYDNIKKAKAENITYEYTPCFHKGNEPCDEKCSCFLRGFCEKYCVCSPSCNLKFNYCKCKHACKLNSCPCLVGGRECDPELCKHCCDSSLINKDNFYSQENSCWNKSCRLRINKKTAIANSKVAGCGLFAMEKINKNEMIQEYTGEILDYDECEKRHLWNDVEEITYIFELNDNFSVDSKYMGNKLRFANHSKNSKFMNAYAKNIFSEGSQRICLYALKDIEKHEEIRFDYDGNNLLCEKFDWINDNDENEKKIGKNNNNNNKISHKNKSAAGTKNVLIKTKNQISNGLISEKLFIGQRRDREPSTKETNSGDDANEETLINEN